MSRHFHRLPWPQGVFSLAYIFFCSITRTFALSLLPGTCNENIAIGENASYFANSQILKTPFPHGFPDSRNAANLFPMRLCNGIPLEEATIQSLQNAMHIGRLTSSQMALCYLQRIYQTDSYIEYVFLHSLNWAKILSRLVHELT